jgi:hypothetical protein
LRSRGFPEALQTNARIVISVGQSLVSVVGDLAGITASSPRRNTRLLQAVQGKAPEVYLVGGDDPEPGCIMNAIRNGYKAARAI